MSKSSPPPAPSWRILYVEDDAITAHNTLATLEDFGGAEVSHCRSWPEAQGLLERVDFDLALLDVHLEGSPLDGIDIGFYLDAHHRLPIVVATGAQDERTLTRLSALPSAQYLLKPYSPTQLKACLRRVARLPPPEALTVAPAKSHLDEALQRALFIPFGQRRLKRVDFVAIDFLAADGAYTDIVLRNGRRCTIDYGIRATIRLIGRDDVVQVHKSFAAPIHAVDAVSNTVVSLRTGEELPLGRTYRHRVFAALRLASSAS